MKITNREILSFATSMFGNKHFPVKLSYAISVNADAISGALKAYDEAKKQLVDQYAKKDEDGKPIIENDQYVIDDIAGWNEAIRELQDMEAEVNITTVSLKDIAKCDDPEFDDMTVADMAVLKFMIK